LLLKWLFNKIWGLILNEINNKTKEIIQLILSKKKELTVDDVLKMIEERINELGGLIDEEAAAMLIAKELGIRFIPKDQSFKISSLKIKDISSGYRNIILEAYILKVSEIYNFRRADEYRKYVRILLGDDTGQIWMVLWDNQALKAYEKFIPGDLVRIEGGFCRKYRDKLELGLLKNGKISITRKAESLEQIYNIRQKFDLNIVFLHIIDILQSKKSQCLYCLDENKGWYRVTSFNPLSNIKTGDKILLQDSRIRKISNNIYTAYISGLTRIYILNKLSTPKINKENEIRPLLDKNFLKVTSDSVLQEKDLDIEGIYIGFIPFRRKGGSLWLTDENKNIRIPLFDDDLLDSLINIEQLQKIRIKGVTIRKTENKIVFRALNCSEIVFLNEKYDIPNIQCSHLLTDKSCFIKNTSSIVNFSLGIREYNGKIIGGINIKIDDGTAQSNILTNKINIIEKFLGLSASELLDYKKDNILADVIDYLKEDLLGKNLFVEGILLKSGMIIPSNVEILK